MGMAIGAVVANVLVGKMIDAEILTGKLAYLKQAPRTIGQEMDHVVAR